MRLTCPHCGERDLREFASRGNSVALSRPSEGASPGEWADYLHIRDNSAGEGRDLFYHTPCGLWIEVTRSTITHAVTATRPVREAKP